MPFIDKSTLTYPATNSFPVRKWLDQNRAPTSGDYKNFQIFDVWIFEGVSAWIMIDRTATSGTWIQFSTTGTGILTITGDAGGAVGADGANNINLLTGAHLTATGNPGTNTITLTLDSDIASQYTADAGTAVPAGNNLNILGTGGITTSGAGSTITVTGGVTIPTSFVTDAGTATPALNILNVLGGVACATTGAGNTVTVNLDADVATQYTTDDANTAVPAGNNLNIFGSNGIVTSSSGSTITISVNGGGISWTEVTVLGPTTMTFDHGYVANNAGQVGLLLPLTATFGSEIHIVGKGAGGWIISQNAGQSIRLISSATTVGITGTLAASEAHACVILRCITANTLWTVETSMGNFIISQEKYGLIIK